MRFRRWLAALVAPLAACGAGTGPGADASVTEDASHDAGRDAARDADLGPRDAGDSGSDAGTCESPDASYYYADSGPRSDDGGAALRCNAGAIQCPADRRFCCEFGGFESECRASAFDATTCEEHPQRYLEQLCLREDVRCPCDLPWCCRSGDGVCTDHSLLGVECVFDPQTP